MQLPVLYQTRMKEQLGEAYGAYEAALLLAPVRGLRVNTLKIAPTAFLELCPFPLMPSFMTPDGFVLKEEEAHVGNHALHRAGLFYMQEPSAMRPVALLNPQPGMRVLDLCAAPGGKAGQIAARLEGRGLLIANEIVPARANVLVSTLERLGVRNALCTAMKPEPLCALLQNYFDAVLVDAPCSGEGMFRKEPQAVADWSISHVHACALRQSKLLHTAAGTLRPGGRLVYATCTFSREENEDVVRAFLHNNPGFTLVSEERHYPHTGPGEGQYLALLEKHIGSVQSVVAAASPRALPREAQRAWQAFVDHTLRRPPEGSPLLLPDERLMLLPEGTPDCYTSMRVLCAGVYAGELRKGRFVPAHALCMAYPANAFCRTLLLTNAQQSAYFSGQTLEAPEGWVGYAAVLANGYPVGWGKAADGILKNHLPKGLRHAGV